MTAHSPLCHVGTPSLALPLAGGVGRIASNVAQFPPPARGRAREGIFRLWWPS